MGGLGSLGMGGELRSPGRAGRARDPGDGGEGPGPRGEGERPGSPGMAGGGAWGLGPWGWEEGEGHPHTPDTEYHPTPHPRNFLEPPRGVLRTPEQKSSKNPPPKFLELCNVQKLHSKTLHLLNTHNF